MGRGKNDGTSRAASTQGGVSPHLQQLHQQRVLRKDARVGGPVVVVRISSSPFRSLRSDGVLTRFQGLCGLPACTDARLLPAHDGLRREEHLFDEGVAGWEGVCSHHRRSGTRSSGGARDERLGVAVVNAHHRWPISERSRGAEASSCVLCGRREGCRCFCRPSQLSVEQVQHRGDEAREEAAADLLAGRGGGGAISSPTSGEPVLLCGSPELLDIASQGPRQHPRAL